MGGLLLAFVLATPDAAACREALRPEPGSLAERTQVMLRACGPLISSKPCREAFATFNAVGHRPVPLRKLVSACWAPYCRWGVETPCDQPPGKNAVQLMHQWGKLEGAIWRHEATVDADLISRVMARGSWADKVTAVPVASLELHVQGDGVLLVARSGTSEQRWTMPEKPRDNQYAEVSAWLERVVRTSGLVAIAAEPPILFVHVKTLMAVVYAAGLPRISFRVLR